MLSGCKVSCFTKSSSREQISYQHQLSRGLPRLSVPSYTPDVPTYLHSYLFFFSLLSFSSLPVASSCVLCGIKVWIRQMDRALNQSERSILPRLTEKICPDWQTSDSSVGALSSSFESAWFGTVWSKSYPASLMTDMFGFNFQILPSFREKESYLQFVNQYFKKNCYLLTWFRTVCVMRSSCFLK